MKKNDTEHWNQCSACDYLDAMSRAAHSYGEWIIDTEATETAPGTKHRECTACGYVQNGTVIYGGNNTPGDIHNATDPVNNALHADIELTDEDIISMIPLTPEEREAIENGADLTVYMVVVDYSENVPPEDKALAEAQLNGMEKGMYLDIKLYKQIGGNAPAAVTQTNEGTSLKVTFVMPEGLKNQDSSMERTYKIIRVHNGTAEPLTVSYDPATGLGSFYTDRFSTYLLAYTDTTLEAPVTKYPINNPTNGIVKTDKSSAAAGERVSVSVMPGYIAHIFGYNGNEIARISGTGSFIMPAGGVRITAEYPVNFAITWNNSYIYSYDSDMNYITVNRTRKQGTINVDLGKEYAGKSFVIYEGKKSTKVKVTEGVLDADGKITLDVSDGKNYTLVVEDQ
ncbi:MAG: hypothetical protein PUK49_09625 [Oscillospiraceae bacterium]|nr:hypothetical protein [Oscillospiraceae bacterium]